MEHIGKILHGLVHKTMVRYHNRRLMRIISRYWKAVTRLMEEPNGKTQFMLVGWFRAKYEQEKVVKAMNPPKVVD